MNKNFLHKPLPAIIFLGGLIFLIGMNLFVWQQQLFGIILFIVYLLIVSYWLAVFLRQFFSSLIWSEYLAVFLLIYLLAFILGAIIDLYKFSDLFLILTLSVGGVVAWLAFVYARRVGEGDKVIDDIEEEGNTIYINKYLVMALPLLVTIGTVLLIKARTGEYILTPWAVIPKLYVYIFLLVTFVVILLIFSRLPASWILVIIVIYSFFLHAYLPLVYQTGFGGDKWRHLASERYLLTEKVYSPALWGEPLRMIKIGPLNLPEVLVAGNKTSYGNMWAITIIFARLLGVDVFWVDYLLGFILWSLFLPGLLYLWGGLIYKNRQFRLLLAFLPAIFYTMQVFGAITIPVAFGGLFFYFVFYLWMRFWLEGDKRVRNLALGLSALMYFGYILYFLLIVQIAVLVLILQGVKRKTLRKVLVSLWLLAVVVTIPVLERVMGYGSFKDTLLSLRGIISGVADAFGALTGLIAFIPRPIHIDQGNWLYNQTRSTQSNASLLSLSVLPFIFTVLVWGMVALSIEKVKRLKQTKVGYFLSISLPVLFISYIISWYFMRGNHILARRLDLTIVFIMAILLALGIFYILENALKRISVRHKVFGLAMLLAVITTSTYTSGPVLEVVTKDEVEAAKYLWQQIDKSTGKYCVVANTWPLLAVEAESARQIVGGGFPVYLEYAQPERVKIFEGMLRFPYKKDWLKQAQLITAAPECWYMVEKRWLSDRVWQENLDVLGPPQKQIGKVYIWRVDKLEDIKDNQGQ